MPPPKKQAGLIFEHYNPSGRTAPAPRRSSRPRPHICDDCKQTFDRPSALLLHCRSHTGERPEACRYCETAFSTASNAFRHERTCRVGSTVVIGEIPRVSLPSEGNASRLHRLNSPILLAAETPPVDIIPSSSLSSSSSSYTLVSMGSTTNSSSLKSPVVKPHIQNLLNPFSTGSPLLSDSGGHHYQTSEERQPPRWNKPTHSNRSLSSVPRSNLVPFGEYDNRSPPPEGINSEDSDLGGDYSTRRAESNTSDEYKYEHEHEYEYDQRPRSSPQLSPHSE